MSAAGPKSVESVDREPDLDIYDKLRRFDEKLKELEARLAPRVPSNERRRHGSGGSAHTTPARRESPAIANSVAPAVPATGQLLGNAAPAAPNDTRECEGCGQRKPLEEMAVCFLPGTGESFQCEACRGMP